MVKKSEDRTLGDGVARRFVLEVVDVDPARLALPDLRKATYEDIKSLNSIFEDWVCSAIGADKAAERTRCYSPRLHDFLVIDEGSLDSLAELPDDTPPVHLVGIGERRARMIHYDGLYVWLVDSWAVKQLRGDEDADEYKGCMKLGSSSIDIAWFVRARKWDNGDDESLNHEKCEEMGQAGSNWWFTE